MQYFTYKKYKTLNILQHERAFKKKKMMKIHVFYISNKCLGKCLSQSQRFVFEAPALLLMCP